MYISGPNQEAIFNINRNIKGTNRTSVTHVMHNSHAVVPCPSPMSVSITGINRTNMIYVVHNSHNVVR